MFLSYSYSINVRRYNGVDSNTHLNMGSLFSGQLWNADLKIKKWIWDIAKDNGRN